jgi:hypothetical protein
MNYEGGSDVEVRRRPERSRKGGLPAPPQVQGLAPCARNLNVLNFASFRILFCDFDGIAVTQAVDATGKAIHSTSLSAAATPFAATRYLNFNDQFQRRMRWDLFPLAAACQDAGVEFVIASQNHSDDVGDLIAYLSVGVSELMSGVW